MVKRVFSEKQQALLNAVKGLAPSPKKPRVHPSRAKPKSEHKKPGPHKIIPEEEPLILVEHESPLKTVKRRLPSRKIHISEPIPRTGAYELGRSVPTPLDSPSSSPNVPLDSPSYSFSSEVPERSEGLEVVKDFNTQQLERLLNIKWSRYIPLSPTTKQIAAMMLADRKELLFGGAVYGGKSFYLAMESLRFCDLPGYSSIIFRKQLTDLKQAGALIPVVAEWLEPWAAKGYCRYVPSDHAWNFKTFYPGTDIPGPPARLQFGYIGEATVRERYQSAQYHEIGFDELGTWEDNTDYLFMHHRCRSAVCRFHGKDSNNDPIWDSTCNICNVLKSIPLRMRAASNPGAAWLKRRFGIIPDPKQFKSRHEAMIAISEGVKVNWVGTNPERPFIPSYLDDNPFGNQKEYRKMLKEMTEEERSRLEDGNWESRKDSRFKRRWQRFYQLYSDSYAFVEFSRDGIEMVGDPLPFSSLSKIFTTVDTAVTVKRGPVDDKAHTHQKSSSSVISTWGVTYQNSILWLDCRKFRKEIPDLIEELVEVNSKWRPRFNKIECNGVGIGTAQYAQAAGLPIRKNYRKNDKLENSLSAQILMKDGRIYFPTNTTWSEEIEDDVFGWTGLPSEDDDVVDTLADAATEVAPGIAHEISTPNFTRSRPFAVKSVNPGLDSSSIPHYGLRF